MPGTAASTGRYAYAIDAPTEYPRPPLVTRDTTSPERNTGSFPSVIARGSASVKHESRRVTPRASTCSSASFPMNPGTSIRTANPSPASNGCSSGVMSAPHAR